MKAAARKNKILLHDIPAISNFVNKPDHEITHREMAGRSQTA